MSGSVSLTLYVTGHSIYSGNPDDWDGGYTLVLAENPEQALELVGDLAGDKAFKVECTEPTCLARVDPPRWSGF
jgi:hypothetical protein